MRLCLTRRLVVIALLMLLGFGAVIYPAGSIALAKDDRPECNNPPDDPNIPWPPPWCRVDRNSSTRSVRSLLLRLSAPTSQAAVAGKPIVYDFAVLNAGKRNVRDVRLVLPFNPDTYQLIDVTLSRPDAWVRSVTGGQLVIDLVELPRTETITASVRLMFASNLPATADLAMRGQVQSKSVKPEPAIWSNRLFFKIGQAPSSTFDLTAADHVTDGSATLSLDFDGFASNELVSVWYHPIGGTSSALPMSKADGTGSLSYPLARSLFQPGTYQVVAYGRYSHLTVIRYLVVTDCCIQG